MLEREIRLTRSQPETGANVPAVGETRVERERTIDQSTSSRNAGRNHLGTPGIIADSRATSPGIRRKSPIQVRILLPPAGSLLRTPIEPGATRVSREPDIPRLRSLILPLVDFFANAWRFRDGMIYLSPAPLYHSAPLLGVYLTIRMGGTAIIMEHFDPEQYLALVERHRVTHSQVVPTMFSRMLKLPDEVRRRHDVSSLEIAIHGAAPCPFPVKEQMIEWWGPIIHEYYAATEGHCLVVCDSTEWLAHRGTVGRVLAGELHVLDEDLHPVPEGMPGNALAWCWMRSAVGSLAGRWQSICGRNWCWTS
jgi:acyl-CoA synthetase (AMP-forming)/AMP-acid ligase II